MKNLLTFIAASIPGMVVGAALWTAFVIFVLLVYWIGYEAVYSGLLCGHGKGGLDLCDPPDPVMQATVRESMMFFTVIAFTWGEIFAVAMGAFFGGAMGVAITRLFSFVRRRTP